MPRVVIPQLTQLLAKLGIGKALPSPKTAEGGAEAEGEKSGDNETLADDERLLLGKGFSVKDRSHGMNHAERSNVSKYFSSNEAEEKAEPQKAPTTEGETDPDQVKEESAQHTQLASEEELHADEKNKDNAVLAKDDQPRVKEEKAQEEAPKSERDNDDGKGGSEPDGQQPNDDDKERHPPPWALDGEDDDDRTDNPFLREQDPLGETHRCRGHLDDGSQCLRRPTLGTPYCLEHSTSVGASDSAASDGATTTETEVVSVSGSETDPDVEALAGVVPHNVDQPSRALDRAAEVTEAADPTPLDGTVIID